MVFAASVAPLSIGLCANAMLQSAVIYGLLPASISSWQIRYGISNQQAGWITTAYRLSYLFSGIFVTHFGRANKIRAIVIGAVFFALGSLLFVLPQFAGGLYTYSGTDDTVHLCPIPSLFSSTEQGLVGDSSNCQSVEGYIVFFFILAVLVAGAGNAATDMLTLPLFDRIALPARRRTYFAAYYAVLIFGPALGYVGSGISLSYWVDPGHEPSGVNTDDANWVGAWWIPFLVCGALLAVSTSCLALFPKESDFVTARQQLRAIEDQEDPLMRSESDIPRRGSTQFGESKEIPVTVEDFDGDEDTDRERQALQNLSLGAAVAGIKALLRNKVYMANVFATIVAAFPLLGLATFAAMSIESIFHVSPSTASFVLAAIIPISLGGTFVGSWIMKCTKATPPCEVLWLAGFTAGSMMFFTGMMIGCGDINLVGLNKDYTTNLPPLYPPPYPTPYPPYPTPYPPSYPTSTGVSAGTKEGEDGFGMYAWSQFRSLLHQYPFSNAAATVPVPVPFSSTTTPFAVSSSSSSSNFTAACNSGCNCTLDDFHLVCGSDGLTYYSPCFAGCESEISNTTDSSPWGDRVFGNCHCIAMGDGNTGTVVGGQCSTDCTTPLILFSLMLLLGLAVGFCGQVPKANVVMRCVEPEYRPLASSLRNMLSVLLTEIPAPVIYGFFIDRACTLWETNSPSDCPGSSVDGGTGGSCLEYNSLRFREVMFLLGVGPTFLASIIFLYAAYEYRKQTGSSLRLCCSRSEPTLV